MSLFFVEGDLEASLGDECTNEPGPVFQSVFEERDLGKMKRFKTKISTSDPDYLANHAAMTRMAEELQDKLEDWQYQGSERRVNRHIMKVYVCLCL